MPRHLECPLNLRRRVAWCGVARRGDTFTDEAAETDCPACARIGYYQSIVGEAIGLISSLPDGAALLEEWKKRERASRRARPPEVQECQISIEDWKRAGMPCKWHEWEPPL